MASSSGSSTTYTTGNKEGKKDSVVVKVGMVGDSEIGKTSLMVKYVEGTFNEDYIQTLGWDLVLFLLTKKSSLESTCL